MTDVLLVWQHPLIGYATGSWEVVVPEVVAELQRDLEPVWFGPDDAARVDVLFVVYEASDHARVSGTRALEAYLQALTPTVGKLVVCVVDVSRPKVVEPQVREMVLDQVASPAQERAVLRVQGREEFAAGVREVLRARLSQVRLIRSPGALAPDGDASLLGSPATPSPYGWRSV